MSLGILRIFGIILFAYLTWRNLRENYEENEVVSYSWIALLSFFVGGRIIYGLANFGVWNDSWLSWFSVWDKPGMSYVGGFMVLILVNFIFSKVNSWKFFPFCEDSLGNILIFLGFLMGDEFLRTKFDFKVGIYLLFVVLSFLFLKLMKNKYRSFVWYKSGKKGFAFLATCFLFFLILGFLGLYFKMALVYSVLYWIVGLISLIGLCILGEVFNFLKGK